MASVHTVLGVDSNVTERRVQTKSSHRDDEQAAESQTGFLYTPRHR